MLSQVAEADREQAHPSGRDQALLRWITDSGLAVLIADNFAVEAFPARGQSGCCASAPLHEHCLFKLGVHLGDAQILRRAHG